MVREKRYGILATLLSLVTALLSMADAVMFALMVHRGGSRGYLLFSLSLFGAAVLLLTLSLRKPRRGWPTVLCLVWLFANAFVFLLLPSEQYLLTIAVAAPVEWLFKVVPYFFAVALTVVSVTQTMGHKE